VSFHSFLELLLQEIRNYVDNDNNVDLNSYRILGLFKVVYNDDNLNLSEDKQISGYIQKSKRMLMCDFNIEVVDSLLNITVKIHDSYVVKGNTFHASASLVNNYQTNVQVNSYNWIKFQSNWCCYKTSGQEKNYGLVNYFLTISSKFDKCVDNITIAAITEFGALTYHNATLNKFTHNFKTLPIIDLMRKKPSINNIFVDIQSMYCSPIGIIGMSSGNKNSGPKHLNMYYIPYVEQQRNIIGKNMRKDVHYITDAKKVDSIMLIILRPERLSI
jgi:hypothetical protein